MSRPNRSSFRPTNNHSSKFGNMETIDINAEALEVLVLQTLSLHVDDDTALFRRLQEHVIQLANHSRCQDNKLCNFQQQQWCQYCSRTRLNEIAFGLSTIIQNTPSLPAHVTAETHSKIGLLRQKQGNSTGAIQSFMKALWIQSSLIDQGQTTTDTTEEQNDLFCKIAMTKDRLGLAFARNGNFLDAIRLLQDAVRDYQKLLSAAAATKNDHHGRYCTKLLQQAETALNNTLEAQTLQSILVCQKTTTSTSSSSCLLPRFGRSNTTISVSSRRAKSAEQAGGVNSNFLYNSSGGSGSKGNHHNYNRRRRASFASMA